MSNLLARGTRHAALGHIRNLTPVPPARATGLVARVYRQMESDFGMLAPPIALHAAAPGALAGSWTVFRETMLPSVAADRAAKETVAAAVSVANRCPYCVDVHGATLAGLGPGADAAALAADRIEAVTDPRLRALARWARGSPAGPVPFAGEQVPELVAVVVVFEYLNRMVNVFLRESPLPPLSAMAAGLARRGASRVMGRLARARAEPGRSLDLLPGAVLPADLGWAAGQPHIADALARATAVLDEGGRQTDERVRDLVSGLIDAGGPAGTAALDALPVPLRPAGRLAMMTALASYRVTGAVVDAYRRTGQDDAAVVRLTAWASWTAARKAAVGRLPPLGPGRATSEMRRSGPPGTQRTDGDAGPTGLV